MNSIKKTIYSTKYNNQIEMSTIESQIEQKRREIRALRNTENIQTMSNALAKGDTKALLKACRSYVSRNQENGTTKAKKASA